MNQDLKFAIYTFASLYAFIFLAAFQFGLMISMGEGSCKQSVKRIEYIMPAYRIGCYLGSEVNQND